MEALARINPNGWGWAGTAVGPYHRFDVGVRDGVKLVEVELVIGADVDESSPVLGHVAVFGRRKDCATRERAGRVSRSNRTNVSRRVMKRPSRGKKKQREQTAKTHGLGQLR